MQAYLVNHQVLSIASRIHTTLILNQFFKKSKNQLVGEKKKLIFLFPSPFQSDFLLIILKRLIENQSFDKASLKLKVILM